MASESQGWAAPAGREQQGWAGRRTRMHFHPMLPNKSAVPVNFLHERCAKWSSDGPQYSLWTRKRVRYLSCLCSLDIRCLVMNMSSKLTRIKVRVPHRFGASRAYFTSIIDTPPTSAGNRKRDKGAPPSGSEAHLSLLAL